MKKVCLTILCVLCMIICSGCMRFDTTLDIKSDGKVDVSMVYAVMNMDTEGADPTEDESFDEAMNELTEAGWTAEKYNEDNYVGFKCSKSGLPLDNLQESLQDAEQNMEMNEGGLSIQKDGNNYVLDWDVLGEEGNEELESYKSYFSTYGGYMQVRIKLPNKPKNHNATSTEDGGKTLIWDLLTIKENIHVEFSLSIWGTIIKWGLIALAAIILIIVIIIVIKKISAKKAANPQGGFDPNMPPQGGFDPNMPQGGFDQGQQYAQPGYDAAQGAYDQGQQYAQPGYDAAQGAYDQGQQYAQPGYDVAQGAYDQGQQYAQPGYDAAQGAYDQGQQYAQQGYDAAQGAYDQTQQYAQQGYDAAQGAYDQAQQYAQQAYDQSQQYVDPSQQYAQQQYQDPTNNQ